MVPKLSFVNLVAIIAVLAVIAGATGYVVSGATTTNEGTVGAIRAEYAKVMAAEKKSCARFGRYGTIPTLEHEGILGFVPQYNSVVYVPGPHCGLLAVGSAAYQSPAS